MTTIDSGRIVPNSAKHECISLRPLSVLILAPFANPNGVGESFVGAKWIEYIAKRVNVTVLTCDPNVEALRDANPGVRIVNWRLPEWLSKFGRLNWMLKPGYWIYYKKASEWIEVAQKSGESFDIVHQLTPVALRYASPGVLLKRTPFVIGPQAGSLPTPRPFQKLTCEPWWIRIRRFDRVRMSIDWNLKRTYKDAALVLGAADYVQNLLPKNRNGRFQVIGEVGIDRTMQRCSPKEGAAIRFLFVGRLVPTKGVSLLLEAVNSIRDKSQISVDIVGQGPELCRLKEMITNYGLEQCVQLHGRMPRSKVDEFYRTSDVFVFPSYREPSGSVVFEAMSWGLPMIVIDYGGPGANVTEECGIKLKIAEPADFIGSLAIAMQRMIDDKALRERMGEAAKSRAESTFLWEQKAKLLVGWYRELANARLCNHCY